MAVLPLATLKNKCLAYTSYFETSLQPPACFGTTSGNFDGAGMSWGAIQENFGLDATGNVLSPIWKKLINEHPDVCSASFTNQADYTYWRDLILADVYADIKAWCDRITDPVDKQKIIEPWKTDFYNLGVSAEGQSAQIDAAQQYYDLANGWKSQFEIWSRRGYALLFDIAVQSGGISSTAVGNIYDDFSTIDRTQSRENIEQAKLVIIANRKADEVSATWQASYRQRKLCTALGGLYTANWAEYIDPDNWNLTLEPAFDSDVKYAVPETAKTNPIYCFDRVQNLICILDSKDANTCKYYNATMKEVLNGAFTIEFTVPYSHADAQLIPQDGYVIAKDNNDAYQVFCITRVEDHHTNYAERIIFGEHSETELLDEVIENMIIYEGTTATDALTTILSGSLWNKGTVNDTRTLNPPALEIKNKNRREALNLFAERWAGDMTFRVTIGDNNSFTRYFDWDIARGTNAGRRFEYTKDLVEVIREIDTSRIKTALIGVGANHVIRDMPTLKVTPMTGGQVSWHIDGFSYAWDDNNYTYAIIATSPFKDGQADSPAGIVQQISPPTAGTNTYTPDTTATGLKADTTYTFYGGVKTPSGQWWECSQVTVTTLP